MFLFLCASRFSKMLVSVASVLSVLCVSGVKLQVQTDPVRLVSQTGRTSSQTGGRLEIFINNQWGTVCDDSFSITDANVACRQLGFMSAIGYDNAGDLGYSAFFGPIWLDDLDCSTFNTNLRECRHSGIGVHNCAHSEDVVLSCLDEGSLRLSTFSSGSTSTFSPSGRLEIYINGRWGTVCDDGFSTTAANVVCQQMGFSLADSWTSIRFQSQFPSAFSNKDILLDEVQCRRTDLTLLSCPHNGVGNHDCVHDEDVVVYCDTNFISSTTSKIPTDSDPVRLISQTGRTSSQTGGRLEIFINNQWGTVCDDSFGVTDANVACRQLGFMSAIGYDNARGLGYSATTSRIWLDDLDCSSSDSNLRECSHAGIGVHDCVHSEDVVLSCLDEGSLRLSTSSSGTSSIFSPSGRLEIYINDRWGTVCDDDFSITAANVVCQQMGFSSADNWTSIESQSRFPSALSSTDILLDDVQCRSTDLTLLSCPHNGVGSHNCGHFEDVVVYCDDTGRSTDPIIYTATRTSTGAIVGGVIGSISFIVFIVLPFVICIIVAVCVSSNSRRRRALRAVPRTSTVVPTTYSRLTQYPENVAQYPGNFNPAAAQQPPPPHSSVKGPGDVTGVLQEAPPPAYDAAAAYPSPAHNEPPPYPATYPLQPPVYPQQPQGDQNQPPSAADPAYPPPVGYANPPAPYPDSGAPPM